MVRLPKPTPAPAVLSHKLLVVPYLYALAMVFLAIWQLIIFPDFLVYVANFLGGEVTTATTVAAILLVSLEVFSVPFLLRLQLSPLARVCSASCTLLVPMAWSVITMATQSFLTPYVLADLLFIVWGAISFWILGGRQALRVKL